MNCLKNLVSGLRGRPYRPAIRPPPRAPTTRCYHASTRRSHEVVQSARARLFFGSSTMVRRPPQSHALVFPRYYSRRRKPPSKAEIIFRVRCAGVIVVGGVVYVIYNGKFETVPYTNRSHFSVFTHEHWRSLGESQFAVMKKELDKKILPSYHPDSVRVRGLAKEIIRAAHRGLAESSTTSHAAASGSRRAQPETKHLDGINWEVLVVQENSVNAFCLPGGKIVVYTGLLDKFKTDAEIATMLAHEIGHAIARHNAETFTKNFWTVILQVVFLLLTDAPKEMTDITTLIFSLPFSRRMEIEADHIGIMLLAEAGFDPLVAPTVYKKLGKISGNTLEKEEYKSTHPSTEKRSRLLSEPKVMNNALTLYREASANKETEGFFIFSSEKASLGI
ncbi:unnamed protein product [Alopecurus aequalis]